MSIDEYREARQNCIVLWVMTVLAISGQAVVGGLKLDLSFINIVAGVLVALSLLSIGLLHSMRRSLRVNL